MDAIKNWVVSQPSLSSSIVKCCIPSDFLFCDVEIESPLLLLRNCVSSFVVPTCSVIPAISALHKKGSLHVTALYDLRLQQISCVIWTGFSDPYCLLTILVDEEESRTRQSRAKPCKSVVKDAVSDDKIYQTDIKKQTLNPIWNQTFVLWVVWMCVQYVYLCQFRQANIFSNFSGSESSKTLPAPAFTSRCGEANIQSSTVSASALLLYITFTSTKSFLFQG